MAVGQFYLSVGTNRFNLPRAAAFNSLLVRNVG